MRIKTKDNYRVEVYPTLSGFLSFQKDTPEKYQKLEEQEATRIKAEILRHVDDVGEAYVLWDTSYVCSFCGDAATHYITTDEPMCCDEAIQEWGQSHE